jgi:hypothetical protein
VFVDGVTEIAVRGPKAVRGLVVLAFSFLCSKTKRWRAGPAQGRAGASSKLIEGIMRWQCGDGRVAALSPPKATTVPPLPPTHYSQSPKIHSPPSLHTQLWALAARGNRARATASTRINDVSSRSHAVFTVVIEHAESLDSIAAGLAKKRAAAGGGGVGMCSSAGGGGGSAAGGFGEGGEQGGARGGGVSGSGGGRGGGGGDGGSAGGVGGGAGGASALKVSRLHCVDLAGSERGAQLGETGARLEESKTINLSLSALAKVSLLKHAV